MWVFACACLAAVNYRKFPRGLTKSESNQKFQFPPLTLTTELENSSIRSPTRSNQKSSSSLFRLFRDLFTGLASLFFFITYPMIQTFRRCILGEGRWDWQMFASVITVDEISIRLPVAYRLHNRYRLCSARRKTASRARVGENKGQPITEPGSNLT
ncbi:hypothetical protein CC2G_003295 [Coprinopsis cinerea AmutBmut pab1-1]|nr:hypothetical protein CC2G_003295 [Coprinopsis cinerea AmutBmut pab1-1]